jgi:hypothetical protein
MMWHISAARNVQDYLTLHASNLSHDNHSLHTNPPLHNIATVNAFAATRPPDCLSSGLARNANTAHHNLHTTVSANLTASTQAIYAEGSRAQPRYKRAACEANGNVTRCFSEIAD